MAAAPNDPATIRIPMTVVGFDPEVAAANGYPAVPPVSAFSTDVVTGNCGYSSVSLRDVGSKKYTVVTGFGVAPAAVSYTWSVRVTGPKWDKTHRWSGGLALRTTWQGQVTNVVNTGGWYVAKATGTAVLSNGFVCSSGGPVTEEAIY